MRHNLLAPMMAAGAALSLAACGSNGSSADGTKGNALDRAFVAQMVPHHESALNMAEIAQERARSRFVKDLADAIVRTQTAEIATMHAEDRKLASTGIGKGDLGMSIEEMGTEMNPGTLQDADEFDEEFMKMMVPHNEGGVRMARTELEEGSDPELKTLAQGIVDAQEKAIWEIRARLRAEATELGAVTSPHAANPGHRRFRRGRDIEAAAPASHQRAASHALGARSRCRWVTPSQCASS